VTTTRWFASAALLLLAACSPNDATVSTEPAAAAAVDDATTATSPPLADTADAVPDAAAVRIALANGAQRLCSTVFVAGRDRAHVLAEELDTADELGIEFTFGEDPTEVVASAGGLSMTSLYRPQLGCTLVHAPATRDQLLAQFDPANYPSVVRPDASRPWPAGARVELPAAGNGIDLNAVRAAVDAAFDGDHENDDDAPQGTRAVVIVHDGRIVAERYAPPFGPDTPQMGWSMTKTVTNVLTALRIDDGAMDVKAPAPVDAWQQEDDPRRAITLEQLLHMASGLRFSEVYSTEQQSDVVTMLFGDGAYAMGPFAAAMPLEHEPGAHWSYASGTTNIIAHLQRETFDALADYLAFPRQRLFNPLGMASAVIEPDASGVFVGSSYMYATPRDWARIGLLFLQDGVWNGERLLPEGWVDYSLQPAAAAANGQYGAQIWLNRGSDGGGNGRPQPTLPADMYYLAGFEGQNVIVVPSAQLIVVRMGLTRGGPTGTWTLVERVLDAVR
jgi:CubicO group peptidase (beta-lactamase class C family)